MAATVAEVREAKTRGSHKAQLQYPHIDLSRCIGCGACVAACPEQGVIGMVHGQAAVIHGARCIGHGLCAEACGPGAISITLEDVGNRRDLPALTDGLEATGVPNLFLAGEVTGHALIRTAISHGTLVASEVAKRSTAGDPRRQRTRSRKKVMAAVGAGGASGQPATDPEDPPLDLCIVGAGPAGLACSLQAKSKGLHFATLSQEGLGGTVAKYPRRKLVMTQPVDLPLYGRLKRTRYSKEELIELWERIADKHDLPIRSGEELIDLDRDSDGVFSIKTHNREYRARHVCLCLGRRGTPRKLGVPGEELPKVSYSLLDAQSYRGRRILVVGGGDSAIEAALGLAAQPDNEVTLSYRKADFFRLKSGNEERLRDALDKKAIHAVLRSRVVEIGKGDVLLEKQREDGSVTRQTLLNDEVFVFAGGVPPFEILERAGISFDPSDRPPALPPGEEGTGLLRALKFGLAAALATVLWCAYFFEYYARPANLRPDSELHDVLRPSGPLGIGFGMAACSLILTNLLYLLRRSKIGSWIAGSLKDWLTVHVATGLLAVPLVLIHSSLLPRDTAGGHAFAALVVLLTTGAIGRYIYSYLPRAANGRELALDEVHSRLAALSGAWDARGSFGTRVQEEVQRQVARGHWQNGLLKRLRSLLVDQFRFRWALARLRRAGIAEGIPAAQLRQATGLGRRAHRVALMAAHYEDLRGLLGSWRYLHRWVALAMVALAVVHVVTALNYGDLGG